MILTCPACKTRFEIDVDRIGSKGRLVRCGQCGETWRQNLDVHPKDATPKRQNEGFKGGPRQAAAPYEAVAAEPKAPDSVLSKASYADPGGVSWPARPSRERAAASPGNWAGWVLLFVFLAALGSLGYFGRDMVVAKIPPMSRLYALAGLSVSLPKDHLSLENVTSVRRLISGDRVLIIEGEVLNTSDDVVSLPPLKARLEDEDGNEISSWTFSASDAELGPGESAQFETSTRNPPKDSKTLTVALAPRY